MSALVIAAILLGWFVFALALGLAIGRAIGSPDRQQLPSVPSAASGTRPHLPRSTLAPGPVAPAPAAGPPSPPPEAAA